MQDNFFTSFLIDRTTGKTVSIVEIFNAINGPSADSKVKVTVDDTTTDFLSDKLTAGAGISLNILDSGANETLQIVSDMDKNFEFVVDASGFGGAFTTIQSAVTAAEATGKSEAIWIYPGTYTEDVTITQTEIGLHGMTLWAQDSTLLIGDLIFNVPTTSTNSINELDVSGSLIINGTAANLIWVENFDATVGGGASPIVINNTNTSTTIIGHRSRFTETSDLAPAMNAISSGGFDGSDCEFRRNGSALSNLPAILLGGNATFIARDTRINGQVDLNSSDNFSLTGGDSQITTSGSADVIENTGHTGLIFVIAASLTSLGGGSAITVPTANFFYSRLTIGFSTLFNTSDGTDFGVSGVKLINDGSIADFLNATGEYSSPVAGTTTQVQFNNAGVLAGNSNLIFDPTSNLLTVQNFSVTGDAQVDGTLTVVDQVNLSIETGFINMNTGLTVPLAKEGGLVVNFLPTSTNDTVTAGLFSAGITTVVNPTVVTDTASVFVANDIIQISGTTGMENNGIYEVETHVGNLLTIRGIGTVSTVETFTNNQFITATDNAIITKINVALLDCHTDGIWHQGQGNQVPIIRTLLGGEPAGSNTQIQFNDNGVFGAVGGFTFVETFPDVTMTLSSGLAGTAAINFTSSTSTLKGFLEFDENFDTMSLKSQNFAMLSIQASDQLNLISDQNGVGILAVNDTTFIQTSGPSDNTATLGILNTGTNGGSTNIYSTDRDPTGNITALPGSLAFREDGINSDVYVNKGSISNNTDWEVFLHSATTSLTIEDLNVDVITFNDGSTQTQGALPNYSQGILSNSNLVQSLDISLQDTIPNGLTFKQDGLKMYVVGNDGNDILEYNLSIPWNVSTAVFFGGFSVGSQDTFPQGVEISLDGTRMYMVGSTTDSVFQYDLITPYSVIGALVDNAATLDVSVETSGPTDIRFRPDGLQIYVTSPLTGIAAYNLTSPFDLTTATFSGDFFNTTTDITDIKGMDFRCDGIFMYLGDDNDNTFHQYQLSEPWKILTARHITKFIPSPSINDIRGLYSSPEAHKFYFVERSSPVTVVEYDMGVEFSAVDIIGELNYENSPSVIQNIEDNVIRSGAIGHVDTFDFVAQEGITELSSPLLAMEISPDGTKYFICENGPSIRQYNMSVPGDITTGVFAGANTFNAGFSIQALSIDPAGLNVITIQGGGIVRFWTLPTPYDFDNAVQGASISPAEHTTNWAAGFSSLDGRFLYLHDQSGDLFQYSRPGWDSQTLLYTGNTFDFGSTNNTQCSTISSDGRILYMNPSNDDLREYTLTTPWDLSTAVLINTNTAIVNTLTRAIRVSADGSRFYDGSTDIGNGSISQYSLGINIPSLLLNIPSGESRSIDFDVNGRIEANITYNDSSSDLSINTTNAQDTDTANSITLSPGDGGSTSGNGGAINLISGSARASTDDGGAINFTTGNGFGTSGVAGDMIFNTGDSGGGTDGLGGGNVIFTLGNNPGDPGSNFTVLAGFGGEGGDVSFTAGGGGVAGTSLFKGGLGGFANAGGSSTLQGGDGGTTNATGGIAQVLGGTGGGTNGAGGAVTIIGAGALGASDGGAISLTSGAGGATSGSGGSVNITTGNAPVIGAGGAINLLSGDGGSTGGDAGNITITTGSGIGGDFSAGSITLAAGFSDGSGTGGDIFITGGGGGSTGAGGILSLGSGDGGVTSGNGGTLNIESGNAIAGNSSGGEISIQGGSPNGTGDFGLVSLQSGGGQVGINQSNPNASSILDIVSTTQGFLKPRMTTVQKDAISTPATGLELFDSDRVGPEFFDSSSWIKLSGVAPTAVEIFKDSDLDDLATAGIITIANDENLTIELKTDLLFSATEFVLEGTGELRIWSANADAVYLYNGTGTMISGSSARVSLDNIVLVSINTGTFIATTGATLNIQLCAIIGFANLGSIDAGQNFVITASQIESCDSGFTVSNMNSINLNSMGIELQTMTGNFINWTPGIRPTNLIISRVTGGVAPSAAVFGIDPSIPDGSLASVVGCTIDSGSLFETTGGSTGTFTAVADSSVGVTTINSVSDSSGVARFNFTVGPTIFVNQEVVIENFVTNTAYNGTFLITATGIGFFEIASVAFGTDEAGGSFQCFTVTMTDTTTTLVDGDTLVIDTDFSTDYDNGAVVYNQLVNSFQINRTFTVTQTGTWDTNKIDQTDPRILTSLNPGFVDAKYIATAFVNNNSTANGAIVNNTFTAMVFGTGGSALISGSTIERWKLIDEISGVFEYVGNEPFDGYITFDFTVISVGGVADFRFKWEKDTGSGFADLDDNVEALVAVGTDAQSITKTFPLAALKGDQIRPRITRNTGSSTITTSYASIYATQ